MQPEIEIICPKCQNLGEISGKFKTKKCFYNPEKDCWHCYHCDATGRGNPTVTPTAQLTLVKPIEFQFTEDLLSAYIEELNQSERALDYVIKRLQKGWSQFKLGYDSGRDHLVIPIYNELEQLVGVKYRALTEGHEPKYVAEPGSQAGFYFLKGTDATKVLLVEGEFDAMTARLLGFEGHIVATQRNGANDSQIKRLRGLGFDKIYVAPDQDDAGDKLKQDLTMAFEDSLREIDLQAMGVKDLNDLLTKDFNTAIELFAVGLKKAKTLLEQSSYSVFDRIELTEEYLRNPVNTTGWSTGYPLFDDWLGGGLLPYTLTGLSAPGKTGKTSLINQLCFNLAVKGVKVGSLSLEMSPITYSIPSLLSIGLQKNIRALPKDSLTEVIEQAREDLQFMNNIIFYDGYGVTPADTIDKWIRGQHEKNGVSVFFLDHVGYSLKDIKDAGEHSLLSKRLRSITRDLPIHIIAVIQPKQLQFGQKSVTKHDLYGSVTYSQDINQLMTLERTDKGTKLRLTDSHYPLAKTNEDGLILFYDHNTCTLRN